MFLREGLEAGDLKRLVKPVLSIDEFKSKMGSDTDICVLAFTTLAKEAAEDLVNFVEKSYEFVLDADCSSGEDFEGNHFAFVELERTSEVPKQISEIIADLLNLTEQDLEEWKFTYYKKNSATELTEENLANVIVTSPEKYKMKFKPDEEIQESAELNAYAAMSGAPVTKKIAQNHYVSHIQSLAGIK
jgi:hypothetical protein